MVGLSTFLEDYTSLKLKLAQLRVFLESQPDLLFYSGIVALCAVGIALIAYDFFKPSAPVQGQAHTEETPLKEVAALIFSKIDGGTPSAFLSVYADNPKDQIRGIADLITLWYPVIGRFPGTQTKQVIKPGTFYACYDSDGSFAATANPPENTVQFERLSLPTKDAGRVSTELISRLEGMM